MLQHTHIQSYKHSFISAEREKRERCCRPLVVEACGWVGTMMMRIVDLVFKINFFFLFGYNIGVFVFFFFNIILVCKSCTVGRGRRFLCSLPMRHLPCHLSCSIRQRLPILDMYKLWIGSFLRLYKIFVLFFSFFLSFFYF